MKKNRHFSMWNIQIWHHPYLFLSKNIKIFQWLSISKFLSFMTKVNPNNVNENGSDIFPWNIFKSDTIDLFFYLKFLQYLNDSQNQNFSVFELKWTKTMEIKKSHTFSYGTYSRLTSYLFFLKKIYEVFQWPSKSKFLSFMTTVNPNIGIEIKSDIFDGTYSNLTSFFIRHKILKKFQWLLWLGSFNFIVNVSKNK